MEKEVPSIKPNFRQRRTGCVRTSQRQVPTEEPDVGTWHLGEKWV